jgi:uncharacterized protein YggE
MKLFAAVLLVALSATAQVTAVRRSITATGQADVAVTPDQARVVIAVVTQGTTADDAVMQNASTAQAVIAAVNGLIGNAGSVRTSAYSVSPGRDNSGKITGYTVTNSILATVNNLAITGRVMDAAVAAGANRIDGLSLGLQNDEPVRVQALRAAGQIARARATAIAAGLGVNLGQVLTAGESGVVVPTIGVGGGAPGAATTAIEAGTLTVTARITVEYEIVP